MQAKEVYRIIDESARRLLQSSSPSVRYWVLTDIMKKGREDLAVQRALEECVRYPPRLRILDNMRADGTWPIPESQRRHDPSDMQSPSCFVHMAMLRNLLNLLHFVTGYGDERVYTSLDRLLTWQTKEGYIRGPITNGLPQPHYNGYALYVIAGFFEEEDPRARRLAEWLMSIQRKDGGWNMPYIQDVKYLPEYKDLKRDDFVRLMQTDERNKHDPRELQGIPSCHWTTMMVLWGLNEMLWTRRSECVRKGADFLIGRFFQRNHHSNFYESERNWMTVKYPHNKCNGLAALDVLTKSGRGPDDPRMEKPIRWLMSARYRDGLWTESDRPHTETGQWITLMALISLDRYAQKL